MYAFLGLLIVLLIYSLQETEAFTIHIEGGDVVTPLKNTVASVANGLTDGIRNNITRPAYSTLVGFVPYRHHYRRMRRQFYAK